ncbi:hypothetical protein PVAND_006652 [Polypedilum vanderplanki]|uniref:Translocation protein SEC62 n=1 Tax=Polypedilum vanderplanki TaxID=319348 RepID=A0A9J6C4M4_POLVA|nr:hypothetical protein PVAND_006652 [Polypedilum vanderplanki]
MSGKDKRVNKKKKDEYKENDDEQEKASKEEYKVAKWIRNNVPVKKTKFLNHNVEYFTSAKALDALMTSKFAQGDNCLFPTRQIAIDYMDKMLAHKFFHRAKKIPVSEMELRGGRTKDKSKDQEKKETDAESSHEKDKSDKATSEKKKRKIRLEMHPQQIFIDGHEAYVWIYDPIPMTYWIFGALVVIGAIVICLFPLWPPQLRTGVYYLSMTAAGFLVFLLALVVVRFILFCTIWICTGGKHHFWFLLNLTEDVGFIDSFKPLYKHDYIDSSDTKNKKDKDKKKKKKKDSDDESGNNKESELVDTKAKESETNNEGSILQRRKTKAKEQNEDIIKDNEERKNSESESSDSQRSSTDKDFEIVDAEEDHEE